MKLLSCSMFAICYRMVLKQLRVCVMVRCEAGHNQVADFGSLARPQVVLNALLIMLICLDTFQGVIPKKSLSKEQWLGKGGQFHLSR